MSGIEQRPVYAPNGPEHRGAVTIGRALGTIVGYGEIFAKKVQNRFLTSPLNPFTTRSFGVMGDDPYHPNTWKLMPEIVGLSHKLPDGVLLTDPGHIPPPQNGHEVIVVSGQFSKEEEERAHARGAKYVVLPSDEVAFDRLEHDAALLEGAK